MLRILSLYLALGLVASAPARAALSVVTTHADLAALARAVGGERVEVAALVEPTQDPHFVDPRPHLMLQLSRANLLIVVGLELEIGWLPTLLTGARNPRILPGSEGYLDSSTLVERRDVPAAAVDRSQGDVHPGGNPHFTRSPVAARHIAGAIARALGRLDPAGASTYRRNLASFERALSSATARWLARLAPYRGSRVVAYHRSWVYFTEWAGLEVVDFVEPKPGLSPDPGHVAQLLRRMRQDRVPLILQEEYYPATTTGLVADKSGARLVRCQGGVHLAEGDDYVAYLDRLVEAIAQALAAGAAPAAGAGGAR